MENIKDKVISLLTRIGYTPIEEDEFLIDFTIDKVGNDIKNYCNISEVPEGLAYVFVYRVCGEFLKAMKNSGSLEMRDMKLDVAFVTSISMGDTSTSFSDKGSDEARIDSLINYLCTTGQDSINAYRCIRW